MKPVQKYLDHLLGTSSSLDDSLSFFCLMCFLLFPLSLSLLFFFPFCLSLTASPSLSLSSSKVYVRFFLSISMACRSIARAGFSTTCLRGIYKHTVVKDVTAVASLEVSFPPTSPLLKMQATTVLCKAFKIHVNMLWQVQTRNDYRIYLVKEFLRKGNHTLVNVNRARLLETSHKVLRARCFPSSPDHELRHISVTQPEDIVETVIHPLL